MADKFEQFKNATFVYREIQEVEFTYEEFAAAYEGKNPEAAWVQMLENHTKVTKLRFSYDNEVGSGDLFKWLCENNFEGLVSEEDLEPEAEDKDSCPCCSTKFSEADPGVFCESCESNVCDTCVGESNDDFMLCAACVGLLSD